MIKKAAFFSPYLDTLGGGERYFFSVVNWALKNDFQVNLFWPNDKIIYQAKQRFGLDLRAQKIKTSASAYALLTQGSFWERIGLFDTYDFVFFVSDGSLPFLYSKGLSLVHFQVPFSKVKKGLAWWLKKKTIDYFIFNSEFTQNVLQPQLGQVKTMILYPPVDTLAFQNKRTEKEKIILAVGRFDQTMQAKRQDFLIEVFKTVSKQTTNWKFILAGGTTNYDHWLKPLQQQAEGYPIEFVVNPSWQQLKKLYQQATIFWHAAGYGVDPLQHPEKMEHFGITTVEALAAGCIPIVYNGGGLSEIIKNGDNGFLFSKKDQLGQLSLEIIKEKVKFSNQTLIKSAQRFSQENFYQKLNKLWRARSN